jgi:hypothetical protein
MHHRRWLAALAAGIFASSAAALRIDLLPVTSTVDVNDSTTLSVVVSGLDDANEIVSSFDLSLTYDAAIVDASSVQFGTLLGGPVDSLQVSDLGTPGSIFLAEVSLLGDSDLMALQGDTVTLGLLRFLGVDVGISSIQLASVLLSGREDPSAPGFPTELDPDIGGARIIVEPGNPVSEPASTLLVLTAFALCAVFRRARAQAARFH